MYMGQEQEYYIQSRLAEQERQNKRRALQKHAAEHRRQQGHNRSAFMRVMHGLSHLARVTKPAQQQETPLTNFSGCPVRTEPTE